MRKEIFFDLKVLLIVSFFIFVNTSFAQAQPSQNNEASAQKLIFEKSLEKLQSCFLEKQSSLFNFNESSFRASEEGFLYSILAYAKKNQGCLNIQGNDDTKRACLLHFLFSIGKLETKEGFSDYLQSAEKFGGQDVEFLKLTAKAFFYDDSRFCQSILSSKKYEMLCKSFFSTASRSKCAKYEDEFDEWACQDPYIFWDVIKNQKRADACNAIQDDFIRMECLLRFMDNGDVDAELKRSFLEGQCYRKHANHIVEAGLRAKEDVLKLEFYCDQIPKKLVDNKQIYDACKQLIFDMSVSKLDDVPVPPANN